MNKNEFLYELRQRLSGLPPEGIEERLAFYSEIIDDRIEDGLSEEDAVASVGSIDEVVGNITSEIPLSKLVGDKVKPKRSLKAWEVVCLIISFPLWGSLMIAAFAVVLSLYIAFWAVIASLFIANLALAISAIACIPIAIVNLVLGNFALGGYSIGLGFIGVALSLLMFVICRLIAKGLFWLTDKFFIGLKSIFI